MNTVISMLLLIVCSYYSDSNEYSISYAILKNLKNIEQFSAENIAEMANVSTRAISNFSKRLGYKNFSALKSGLLATVEVRKLQMASHIQFSHQFDLLDKIQALSVIEFDKDKFEKNVEKLNDSIFNSEKVIILGAVFPELLSMHYMEDMIISGKLIYTRSLFTTLETIEANTTVIFISFTGRMYTSHYDLIRQLKERNVHVFGIGNAGSKTQDIKLDGFIELPCKVDSEEDNALLLLILQYCKMKYVETKCE